MDDWDPRVDSGGRPATHPDFGKESPWNLWIATAAAGVLVMVALVVVAGVEP